MNEDGYNTKRHLKYGKREGTNIVAAEGRLYFYLGNLTLDTGANELKEYIEDFLNDNIISIEELKTSKAKNMFICKSFKVVTSTKHLNAMYNMDNWPKRTVIRKFKRSKIVIDGSKSVNSKNIASSEVNESANNKQDNENINNERNNSRPEDLNDGGMIIDRQIRGNKKD